MGWGGYNQRCKQPTDQPTEQLPDYSASPDFFVGPIGLFEIWRSAMATLNELKDLFKSQEERYIKRREKEKEEEEEKRKEDTEEVKEMFKSHMLLMKEDIKDIRNNQEQIEGQVVEYENKLS